jgi:hypothetical protein
MRKIGDEYDYVSYELKSIIQVEKMYAVYAVEHPTEQGKYRLSKTPLHFMGLAEAKTERMRVTGDFSSEVLYVDDISNEPVGVCFYSGYPEICNEADNFAGILHEGDPIENADGCLHRGRYPLEYQS